MKRIWNKQKMTITEKNAERYNVHNLLNTILCTFESPIHTVPPAAAAAAAAVAAAAAAEICQTAPWTASSYRSLDCLVHGYIFHWSASLDWALSSSR
jgi:hypothetical protein